ncbi:MAG: hypothetical protein F6J89_16620 [Symploca sp. SIO1C4]|uniref:Uncharacterized protein n=1 Tax=Symploca sp. SIO1C4 TaxID=2607765 RepID=A0A6B3NCC7_9CYAN|nr:hypothetical protein [Symploca sp. SIO1C4]
MLLRLLKFLRWSIPVFVGLLAIWIVGGNFLAAQLEKEIEQEIDKFAQQFPETGYNNSALKLQALTAKSGMGMSGTPDEFTVDAYISSHPDFRVSVSTTEIQAFRKIMKQLEEYLEAQIATSNDQVDPPPEELQRYLASKADSLEAIRNHVLNNEVPQFPLHITPVLEGNNEFVWPNNFSIINLQRLLLLDILEKKRRGQTQAALEMLEVSWKINKSFLNKPTLIYQLVSLFFLKEQIGVIRKLDSVPPKWQQRLLEHNYRQSLLTTIEGEFIFQFRVIQNLNFYSFKNLEEFGFYRWFIFLGPIAKPYYRLVAVDNFQVAKQALSKKQKQNICSSDVAVIYDTSSWWNIMDFPILAFINQTSKTDYAMLELELTQKILQIKELAAKEGKWPESVPNLESSICPGEKWIYQVSPDNTMSISFSAQPEWLQERIENGGRPLTYSDSTIPD